MINLPKKDIETCIDRLWKIIKNPNDFYGICSNMYSLAKYDTDVRIEQVYNVWYLDIVQTWPEYSGGKHHPVKAPRDYEHGNVDNKRMLAVFAYDFMHKWQGEYGASRIRLAKWLIRQLQKELP